MSYPYFIRATRALFNNLTMKYTPKIRGRRVRLMLSNESHKPPLSGDTCDSTSTGAPSWPSKWPAKWTHFASLFHLLLPWQPPGQYEASSHLMAVFSGFYESPGPPSLAGNVGKCVCRLHPSNDRHFCLSPTCRKCRPDTLAVWCKPGWVKNYLNVTLF